MQERQAALAAVASRLWQNRSGPAPSSPQPPTSARAVPTISTAQQGAVPDESPAADKAALSVPTSSAGAHTVSSDASVMETQPGVAKSTEQSTSWGVQLPAGGPVVGQQEKSQRESRAAARVSRLAQTSGSGSLQGSLSQSVGLMGNPEEQKAGLEEQKGISQPAQIPQADGPADDDSTQEAQDSIRTGTDDTPAVSSHGQSATAADRSATAATVPHASHPQLHTQPQAHAPESALPATQGFAASDPAPLGLSIAAAPPEPNLSSSILKRTAAPSALQQMAAHYLSPSSVMPTGSTVPAAQQVSASTGHSTAVASQTAAAMVGPAAAVVNPTAAVALPAALPQQIPASNPQLQDSVRDTLSEQQKVEKAQDAMHSVRTEQPASRPILGAKLPAIAVQHDQQVPSVVGGNTEVVLPQTQVVCPGSGRNFHFGCLSEKDQAQVCIPCAYLS